MIISNGGRMPTWIVSKLRRHGYRRGPEHRSMVVIDIAGSAQWHNEAQLSARAALKTAIRAAVRQTGIAWTSLAVEDRGDGMILLVAASVSKVDVIDPLIPHLAVAIREHNAATDPAFRIRLRVAVHAGEVHRDANGWVGSDLNTACRLVNSAPLYQELRRSPQTDLVLIVSDLIYQGVVRHHYRDIDPASYLPVHVLAKETNTHAWLHNTS